MMTDKQGNRYYTAEEALDVLGVSRSTFQKMASKLTKYRRARDKRHYYRVEDIEKLKSPSDEFWPIREEREEQAPAA